MKLHYSQTKLYKSGNIGAVLLPYEITLFSNSRTNYKHTDTVLLPYEITLFSNMNVTLCTLTEVLLPYEITLFSNKVIQKRQHWRSFTTL